MKILADENIPHVKELFAEFAEIITCEGRNITADKLSDIDILLVRSTTKINQKLLEKSAVQFVGSATIGLDHIDTDWLKQQKIACYNAPGCNAIAVAEYVLSGLLVVAEKFDIDLRKSKVGIIGAGNIGTAVSQRLEMMGIPFGLFDPPLQQTDDPRTMINQQELAECEFITLHIPFTSRQESQWPTENMVNEAFFSQMTKMRYLINTSRGHVVDNQALKNWLDDDQNGKNKHQCVIDVWQNEPFIDCDLLDKSLLGTPHIAGHSREGKSRGTMMLFQAFCQHFEFESNLDEDSIINRDLPKDIIHLQQEQSFMQALSSAVWAVYDIRDDDKALRAGLSKDITQHFDRLRKGYKERREFSAHRLDPVSLPDGSRRTLKDLGFRI